jgi:hypothetical protein
MPVSRRRADDPGTHIAIGYVDSTIKYSRPLDWQHADAALR